MKKIYKLTEEQEELLSWFKQLSLHELESLTKNQRSEKWQLEHWQEFNELLEDTDNMAMRKQAARERKEKREQRMQVILNNVKKLHDKTYYNSMICEELNITSSTVNYYLKKLNLKPHKKRDKFIADFILK